jgi:hypothetical protein
MNNVNFESSAVQNYLIILQNIVNRLAGNSANCKTWGITLVSAIVVFAYQQTQANVIWVALIPLTLCFLLDIYYLALEKHFRNVYNDFVRDVHAGTAKTGALYVIPPPSGAIATLGSMANAIRSFSIWPFYGLIIVMLIIARTWIL